MNKKLIGICVCILFFGASVCPSIAGYEKVIDKKEINDYNNLIKYAIESGALSNNVWREQDKLLASDGAEDDYFGGSVSIDGDYAIIGAPYDDGFKGSAYVFKRDGTIWTEEQKLLASDGELFDHFGWSVSIDGDYALIGAPYDDGEKGSAYVFKRDGTTWTQEDKLIASDGASGDIFGYSVSISGDYAIIGAPFDDNGKGSAYVFKRSGTTWTQEDKLIASDGASGDIFGYSVSIDGDYAVIGAFGDDDVKGSAYVFKRSGTTWTQEDKLIASDGEALDRFGGSVSIDGDYAVIGAGWDDNYKGSAYVFKRDGTTWTEEQKLLASDGATDDRFGWPVSIDGDYAVIGAFGDDNYKGSAYVFKRSGTTWTQEDKLIASDGEADDEFGASVSISGDYAIIGAPGDDDNGDDSGSAYVFTKESENQPPTAPEINGETNGKVGTEYDYEFTNCVDPNGDDMTYHVEWDDGGVDEGFVESGGGFTLTHSWDAKGDYTIKAKLIDEHGAESDWAELSVTMPRNKIVNTPFLNFLESHPILYQLLQRFLQL